MAERLRRRLLHTYGIADLFFALMINMEAYFFTAFLTDYAQFSLRLRARSSALPACWTSGARWPAGSYCKKWYCGTGGNTVRGSWSGHRS